MKELYEVLTELWDVSMEKRLKFVDDDRTSFPRKSLSAPVLGAGFYFILFYFIILLLFYYFYYYFILFYFI